MADASAVLRSVGGLMLALTAAGMYGVGDFLGGLCARRAPALTVACLSQLAGLGALLLALVAFERAAPTTLELAWGGVAGFAGAAGLTLMYRALATGAMSVVAPVTALCAIALPVLAGLAKGERPGVPVVTGMGLAAVAIVLVGQGAEGASDQPGQSARRSHPVLVAFCAGMFFGVFYSCLGQVGGSSGWWPVLAARLVSLSALGIVTTARHVPLVMPRRFTLVVIASGVLDVLGNVCYTIATRHTYLSTTATLVSLYPAATIVLARIVLSERLRPRQLAGLAAALTSIICMTAFR